MRKNILVLLCVWALSAIPQAKAEVTLLDKDDWKVTFSGFAELDAFNDSVRSFTEVAGNNPVDRPDTSNGMSGRTQFSMRNSRLGFGVMAPAAGAWKARGYIETDFLGYDPSVSTSAPTNSESSFYTNPTLRMRHAYLSATTGPWTVLAGQTWSLIAWQTQYVLSTVAVQPVSGTLYERTPQITIFNKTDLNDSSNLRSGFSIVRPPQRDAELPEFDGAVQYNYTGRKAAFAAMTGDVKAVPASAAVSGSVRQFVIPNTASTSGGNSHYLGSLIAFDAAIPILTATDDQKPGNTLIATGEFSTGRGYADELSGWSGNVPQLATTQIGYPVGSSSQPTLDAGYGGYDSSGNFRLIGLRTFSAQLQYHLPYECQAFATVGYGQTYSDNVSGLVASSGKTAYQRSETYFINYAHDFTKQVRVALEFDHFSTNYVDGVTPSGNRIQLSTWFRF